MAAAGRSILALRRPVITTRCALAAQSATYGPHPCPAAADRGEPSRRTPGNTVLAPRDRTGTVLIAGRAVNPLHPIQQTRLPYHTGPVISTRHGIDQPRLSGTARPVVQGGNSAPRPIGVPARPVNGYTPAPTQPRPGSTYAPPPSQPRPVTSYRPPPATQPGYLSHPAPPVHTAPRLLPFAVRLRLSRSQCASAFRAQPSGGWWGGSSQRWRRWRPSGWRGPASLEFFCQAGFHHSNPETPRADPVTGSAFSFLSSIHRCAISWRESASARACAETEFRAIASWMAAGA